MEPHDVVEKVEESWDLDGCLWSLREGHWDRKGADGLLGLLREVTVPEAANLPRRFVSLTWHLPIFLEWQLPRLSDPVQVSELGSLITSVRNEVERLLGVP